ncbi:unnamed protein product [Durusdinium trenchii]
MAQPWRKALRSLSYGAAGVGVLGLGQAAHLRYKYQCPGEPSGAVHGQVGSNYQGKPLKLLFVGDSIAVGVGAKAAAPLQAACAQRLSNLQRRPVEWRTVAQNGADVRELQALLDQPEGGAKVIDLGFDIAVVLCGVNDGKKFWQGRWPSHFREDLAELVRTLRTKGDPESVITVPNLLGHVEAPLFQLWPMCHLVDALFEQFEAQKVALADDGHVRPWSSSGRKVLTTDQNLWSVDGIHPSCEGYQKIGEWLATHLAQMHVVRVEYRHWRTPRWSLVHHHLMR